MAENQTLGARDNTMWPPSLRAAILGAVEREADLGRPRSMDLLPTHPDSAFPTYRAVVRFTGRADLNLFVKDLGSRSRPVEEPARHRECELDVYTKLLIGSELGTPSLITEVPGEGGSHWLVLEFVDGTPLKWLEFEWWLEAATWLGRKDAHFQARRQDLAALPSLRRFDETHFVTLGTRAMEAVVNVAPHRASSLAPVVEYYEEIVEDLMLGTWTLVHGSYRRAQVLVVTTPLPARVCAVDWETAGYGSPVCDLASLCEGFDGERFRALVSAYLDSVSKHGGVAPEADVLCRSMRGHWIYRQLKFVEKSFRRGWGQRHVSGFIDAAREAVDDHRRFLSGPGPEVGPPGVNVR